LTLFRLLQDLNALFAGVLRKAVDLGVCDLVRIDRPDHSLCCFKGFFFGLYISRLENLEFEGVPKFASKVPCDSGPVHRETYRKGLKGIALSVSMRPNIIHLDMPVGVCTFVTGEPALILSRKRGTARLPNKGLALRHDLTR
jgi:hypothetical protein